MTRNATKITANPDRQELFLSREFDARRELVFRAHVDPELFARWFGCEGMTTTMDRFEIKSGGTFRYTQRSPKLPGALGTFGVFHEVAAPERIVRTIENDARPGQVVLETTRFEALHSDRTRVTTQAVFQSVEDRDAVLEAGARTGSAEAMERLEGLLRELKSTQERSCPR